MNAVPGTAAGRFHLVLLWRGINRDEKRAEETGEREGVDRLVVDGAGHVHRVERFIGVQQSGGAGARADNRVSGRQRLAGQDLPGRRREAGGGKMKFDFMWALTLAMTVIGFVAVWFKVGRGQGRQEKTIETLGERIAKNEGDITELKREHADMRVSFAAFMGKIEAKLDGIREAIAELRGKGGRRAEEK